MAANTKGKRQLPRGAQRWFIGEVRRMIEELRLAENPNAEDIQYYPLTVAGVEALVDRFRGEDPKNYLEWHADPPGTFRVGASLGYWDWIDDAFPVALDRFEKELRAKERAMSFDEFLRASVDDTLPFVGQRGGSGHISDEQWASLAESAAARRTRLGRRSAR